MVKTPVLRIPILDTDEFLQKMEEKYKSRKGETMKEKVKRLKETNVCYRKCWKTKNHPKVKKKTYGI